MLIWRIRFKAAILARSLLAWRIHEAGFAVQLLMPVLSLKQLLGEVPAKEAAIELSGQIIGTAVLVEQPEFRHKLLGLFHGCLSRFLRALAIKRRLSSVSCCIKSLHFSKVSGILRYDILERPLSDLGYSNAPVPDLFLCRLFHDCHDQHV